MQLLSRDWKLSTFIGPELISPGLHKTRSSTSALLRQTCLNLPSDQVYPFLYWSYMPLPPVNTCWKMSSGTDCFWFHQHNSVFLAERKWALKTDWERNIHAWTQGVASVTEQEKLERLQGGEALLLQRKHFWRAGTYWFVGNEHSDCTVPQSFPVIIHISLIGNRRAGGEGHWRRLSPNILHRIILRSWQWPSPLPSPLCFFACWELLRCVLKLEVH